MYVTLIQQQEAPPKLNKGFRLLERQLIPQGTLVAVAKFVWGTIWRLMMAELAPRDPTGAYVSTINHLFVIALYDGV